MSYNFIYQYLTHKYNLKGQSQVAKEYIEYYNLYIPKTHVG